MKNNKKVSRTKLAMVTDLLLAALLFWSCFFYAKKEEVQIEFLIVEAIVVLLLATVLVVTYALCRASGSAGRKYEELDSKHFTSMGGEDSGV